MSLWEKIRLLAKLSSADKQIEEGIKMKNATKVIGAIIGLLTFVVQIDSVQHAIVSFITTHPAVALALTGISGLIALVHNPKASGTVAKLLLAGVLIGGMFGLTANAQTPVAPAPSVTLQNLYGAGLSWNQSAKPPVAGTALYAHEVGESDTYAFTVIDALTNTVKPFTVSTNIGVGIAQKVATVDKLPIFVPTAAGISFNGQNTGWQWNSGVATLIPLKKLGANYYLMPTVRFLKSSVSGGTGYQPILGVEFCWGQ